MALKAVTFDFWSTLVDGNITPERTAARLARLHAAIVGAGHACTAEELSVGFERAFQRITSEARDTLRDVGPPGRWAVLALEHLLFRCFALQIAPIALHSRFVVPTTLSTLPMTVPPFPSMFAIGRDFRSPFLPTDRDSITTLSLLLP